MGKSRGRSKRSCSRSIPVTDDVSVFPPGLPPVEVGPVPPYAPVCFGGSIESITDHGAKQVCDRLDRVITLLSELVASKKSDPPAGYKHTPFLGQD